MYLMLCQIEGYADKQDLDSITKELLFSERDRDKLKGKTGDTELVIKVPREGSTDVTEIIWEVFP